MTMLLGQFLLNRGIDWHITLRHYLTQYGIIPIMTKKCIPLWKLVDNGRITFWGRKQSSTQSTGPYSSYRHKGSCRMIAIRSGPHICNSFIWTSSTRRVAPIMLQTASADHRSWRSIPCSTLVGTRLFIGRFSMRVTQNSATLTRHSWGVRKLQIFTSKMHFYVTWDTFVFLQASLPRWYGKHTTVDLLGILGSRKQL